VQTSPFLKGERVPFAATLRFGSLLRAAGVGEPFDPASVVVMRCDPTTGAQTVIAHLMDEGFQANEAGRVCWVIVRPRQTRYLVYFDVVGRGSHRPAYIPPVGCGDSFRYNRPDGLDPLHTHGIQPISADFDGDDDWDLFGGDEIGQIWLIRNIGSNERPVFAPAERIHAGRRPMRITRWQYIPDGNPEFSLGQVKLRYVDWDNDGDCDLLAGNTTHRVLWYENTGTRTEPAFVGPTILQVAGQNAPFGLRSSIATVDWDGDGDWDLLGNQGDWAKAGPVLCENVGTNENPRFKPPARLMCWGAPIVLSAHEKTMAAVDWYGAGKVDLVCGGESGYFYFFRRPRLESPTPPTATVSDSIEIRCGS
jgi:hypothetical protein